MDGTEIFVQKYLPRQAIFENTFPFPIGNFLKCRPELLVRWKSPFILKHSHFQFTKMILMIALTKIYLNIERTRYQLKVALLTRQRKEG